MLQQYLPFTVLKLHGCHFGRTRYGLLQQYLLFTVLKRNVSANYVKNAAVATVLTVYGIETGLASFI